MAKTAAPCATKTATTAPAARRRTSLPFLFKLILNKWQLSLFNVIKFNVTKLEALAGDLKNQAMEGLDGNNIHRRHHALTFQLFNLTELPTEPLLEYDQDLVSHTLSLCGGRF